MPPAAAASSDADAARETSAASAARAEAAARAADERQCVVCLGAAKNTVLLPCKHLVCCVGCAAALAAAAPQGRVCPVCRTAIADTMQVFV